MAIVVSADAQFDEAQAFEFELERGIARATEFVDALEALYQRLDSYPESAPSLEHHIRRVVLQRLGYNVFYRLDGADVVILRIIHGRMDPSHWPS